MERCEKFFSAVIAGFMIGIGGVVYLSMENKIAGAFLFAVGLFSILLTGLYLFTSKIGYIPYQNREYLITLLLTWLGNLLGTYISALLIRQTRLFPKVSERVIKAAETRLSDSFISVFILAVLCGILMFIAVDTYKNEKNGLVGVMAVFVPIMVYVLAGLEHTVADMFYFSLAGKWSIDALLKVITVSIGNGCGALILPLFYKYIRRLKSI